MKRYILVILILMISFNVHAQDKQAMDYSVIVDEEINQNRLELDQFYPVYYSYLDLFYRFGLMDDLAARDKVYIIHRVFYNLSSKNSVQVRFHEFDGQNDLIASFKLIKDENYKGILLRSNYNLKKNKIVFTDKELIDTYARLYHIDGTRLVEHRYLYSADREKELKEDHIPNDLADYYLLDSKKENNKYIEDLLKEEIDTAENAFRRFISKMTLSEYYLSGRKYSKSEQLLWELEDTFDDSIHFRVKNLEGVLDMVKEVYETTKKFELLNNQI